MNQKVMEGASSSSLLPTPPAYPGWAASIVGFFHQGCHNDSGFYSAWRRNCGPTLYPDNKTAVSADVLEAGLIFAAGIMLLSFVLIVPGYRGREVRIYMYCTRIQGEGGRVLHVLYPDTRGGR